MEHLKDCEKQKVIELLASKKDGAFFSDKELPTNDHSLLKKDKQTIRWKSPYEIVVKPQMFVDGSSRFDVIQGALGDCWFLSAATAVATKEKLIRKVIPEGQVLYGKGYTGLFVFRFWRMGTWVTIYIDDKLPVGEDGKLYYSRCRDPDEFWLPLLEKAFAKFRTHYRYLDDGYLEVGLQTLTGCITECIPVNDKISPLELFTLIHREFTNGSLMTCSRGSLKKTPGLVTDHAYTITGSVRLRTKDRLERLVRVRNPWGKNEWSGDWGDNDPRWKEVEESIKKKIEYNPYEDGEFWINMTHFFHNFMEICVSTKIPDYDIAEPEQFEKLCVEHNAWLPGKSSGGSKKYNIEKFSTNPQYLLTVKEVDDIEVCQHGEAADEGERFYYPVKTCSVTIELVQETNREKFLEPYRIAISVYHYMKFMPQERLTAGDFKELRELDGSTKYKDCNSVVARLNLEPGTYVVIPHTKREENHSREFLLRVYCRKSVSLKELC